MLQYIVLIIFIPALIIAVPYGVISQAQLVTIGTVDRWLYNQSSWSTCMCQALQYQSPSIAAFNVFSPNRTCQLISNNFSAFTSFYMIPSENSTLFILTADILTKIKSICCSDTSWLMNKIQQVDTLRTAAITKPVGLTLDDDLNMLVVTYGAPRSIQQRKLTGNMTGGVHPFSKANAQPISYNKGFYYVGINPPAMSSSYNLYVYNTSLTRIHDLYFPQGDPQRAVWLYNDSLMCIIIQRNPNPLLVFLNWQSPSFNLTYNRTIIVPFAQPYGLAKANDDSMIYVSGNTSTIYQLSITTLIWSVLVLNDNSTEIPMSLVIDSCGSRLWVLMTGYGIRVYDRIYGNELASWNLSMSYPNLYDMVLTADYELYLIDFSLNQLIHYGSSLQQQCTIN